MNRDQVQGCGCLAGLVAAMGALGVGGVFLVIALVSFIGWPIALALALAMTAGIVAVFVVAVRFMVAASKRSKTTGPYRAKLEEIDKLSKDVDAAIFRVAGSDFAAQQLRAQLRELATRRDNVLHALIEIDEFLRAPENKSYRIRTESTYVKMRERLAGETVKPELSENAARLLGVQDAVAKVKADRQALIANLDRIAIGLREIRARMLPTAAAIASGEDIARDLAKLTEGIHTEERIAKELDALEQPDDGPRPGARTDNKLPH